MIELGQNCLYSGKMVVFGKKGLKSDKRGCIPAKGCNRAKVVVFRQKLLYSAKVVVFEQIGCIRKKVVVFGQKWL